MNMSMNTNGAASWEAEYAALDPRARAVLECWFGVPGEPGYGELKQHWFAGGAAFDDTLRERFGPLLEAARAGELDAWAESLPGALALVIVLDQFMRNCHRGTWQAFAGDAKALRVAREIVASGADRRLPFACHRAFAYLPLEHSESLADQRESLRVFGALASEVNGAGFHDYALRHARVIERFGRYPHRNAQLGRPSSAAEEAFLREPGSSF